MNREAWRRAIDGEDPPPPGLADLQALFFATDQVLGLIYVAPAEAALDRATRNPERFFDACIAELGALPLREAELYAAGWKQVVPAEQRAVLDMVIKGRKEAETA